MDNQQIVKWTPEIIYTHICHSYKWMTHAVLALYKLQTDEEMLIKKTYCSNGVGFSAVDADFMSDMAELIMNGYTLTDKQQDVVRRILKKYRKQLTKIANRQL